MEVSSYYIYNLNFKLSLDAKQKRPNVLKMEELGSESLSVQVQ